MKEFSFKKIDAFATHTSAGNPAGYIKIKSEKDINEDEMLQIAKELKGFVNEVGYVHQTSADQFDLRFYSSEREVDFCGHATIAIMYDLLVNDLVLQQFENLTIKTNRGILTVENRIKNEDAVFIYSPAPYEIDNLPKHEDLLRNLKITHDSIDRDLPISIINAGLSTLIVPIKTFDIICKITPELNTLKEFCIKSNIDIIEVFTREVADKRNNYRTRVFAPTFGYIEDPATGSGNAAFGYYLLKNNLWTETTVSIEQNGFMDNFNIVKLQKQKDENGTIRVLFGGSAVTRIEGKYRIQTSNTK